MKIEGLKKDTAVWVRGYADGLGDIDFLDGERSGMLDYLSREDILRMLDDDLRLDEPTQPQLEVPQFVADWYEEHKDNFYLNLHRLAWELIENLDEDDFVPKKALDSDFKRWYHKTETAIQTLINMHQFGYTVEKEKSYQIIDKRLNATFSCLGYDIDGRAWFWGNKKFFFKNKGVRLAHTRQQLIDAGFEEVFENPNYEAE